MNEELELMKRELERWRNGETVPEDERCEVKKHLDLNLSQANATQSGRGDGLLTPSLCDTPVSSATNPNISDASELYKLLNEKDEEIHVVTQLNKKRVLEDQLDQMNNELASLKQQEQKTQGTCFNLKP